MDLAALAAVIRDRSAHRRTLTAVAGPPTAGKSTFAERLAAHLNAQTPGLAEAVPMDGYHYDDLVLVPRGLRPRKGAPDTFDVAGFAHMLARLKANAEAEIAIPVFDRSIEIARAGARMIGQGVRCLIVEGNWLLLDEDPWRQLHPLWDVTVMLDADEKLLRRRLLERWAALEGDALIEKIEGNDLPNGRRVIRGSVAAEFVLPADLP